MNVRLHDYADIRVMPTAGAFILVMADKSLELVGIIRDPLEWRRVWRRRSPRLPAASGEAETQAAQGFTSVGRRRNPRRGPRRGSEAVIDLRHSYATAALAAGVPVKVLSQRVGHADVGVTLAVYAHVMPDDDEDAALRADPLFAEP